METQKPHPSALGYGLAAFIGSMAIVSAIEAIDFKLTRLFNQEDRTQISQNEPSLVKVSHTTLDSIAP